MSPEQLQQLAKTKFDIKAAKLSMLERVDAALVFTHAGGLFKATPLLLAEIAAYMTLYNAGEQVMILDEYQNPISIVLGSFRAEAMEARQFALNAYHNEYESKRKVRNGKHLG